MATNTPVVPAGGDTDPTAVAKEMMLREITMLRELLEALLSADRRDIVRLEHRVDHIPNQRHEAVEQLRSLVSEQILGIHLKVTGNFDLLSERITGHFNLLDEKIKGERQVSNERFIGINGQFTQRDTAVAAALQAQKEAAGEDKKSSQTSIAKSEGQFAEAIKQLGVLFSTSIDALRVQVNETKSRLDRGEGKSSVSDPVLTETLARINATMASLATSRDRASVSDPAVAEALVKINGTMNGLSSSRDRSEGKGVGRGEIIALIFSGASFVGTLIAIATVLIRLG